MLSEPMAPWCSVDHIKQGVIDILVATDVVARGLDVPRITHVFNYDIPFDVAKNTSAK